MKSVTGAVESVTFRALGPLAFTYASKRETNAIITVATPNTAAVTRTTKVVMLSLLPETSATSRLIINKPAGS